MKTEIKNIGSDKEIRKISKAAKEGKPKEEILALIEKQIEKYK